MKPLFKKKTKCYVCGEKATALYRSKPVCSICDEKLKHPTKRNVNIESLLALQQKVNKEFNLKYNKLLRNTK